MDDPSTIFQVFRDGLPGLMCLAQGHNAVMPVRLERTRGP